MKFISQYYWPEKKLTNAKTLPTKGTLFLLTYFGFSLYIEPVFTGREA